LKVRHNVGEKALDGFLRNHLVVPSLIVRMERHRTSPQGFFPALGFLQRRNKPPMDGINKKRTREIIIKLGIIYQNIYGHQTLRPAMAPELNAK
jgi:hypothetical protein